MKVRVFVVPVVAIISVTTISVAGIAKGLDGTLQATSIGVIGTIAGWVARNLTRGK